MPTLASIVHGLATNTSVNPDFRLWLTSLPTPDFPVSVLQKGLKVTCEPPETLASNVTASLHALPEDTAAACAGQSRQWRCLLYATTVFHAAAQERRKFGALGWNIPYAFTAGDLSCSLATLRNLLEASDEVPWSAVRFVIGEIAYGGRVTDDNDRAVLTALLDMYVGRHAIAPEAARLGAQPVRMPGAAVDTMASLRELAAELPHDDPPSAFGMSDNAELAFELKARLYLRGHISLRWLAPE